MGRAQEAFLQALSRRSFVRALHETGELPSPYKCYGLSGFFTGAPEPALDASVRSSLGVMVLLGWFRPGYAE